MRRPWPQGQVKPETLGSQAATKGPAGTRRRPSTLETDASARGKQVCCVEDTMEMLAADQLSSTPVSKENTVHTPVTLECLSTIFHIAAINHGTQRGLAGKQQELTEEMFPKMLQSKLINNVKSCSSF